MIDKLTDLAGFLWASDFLRPSLKNIQIWALVAFIGQ